MHYTIVKLKNGEEYSGPIKIWKPAFNWFTLFGIERKFTFDECESITTPGERINTNSCPEGETQDEMERARKDLFWGRAHGWKEEDTDGILKPYPQEKYAWEAK